MPKLSRGGIAYNLVESPYRNKIAYANHEIEYVFSSSLYQEKFNNHIYINREKLETSLSNRFGFKIKNNILFDLNLYSKIEKRGFLIKVDGVAAEWLDNIILDGHNLMMLN